MNYNMEKRYQMLLQNGKTYVTKKDQTSLI